MNIILNSEDILKMVKQKYPSAKSIKFSPKKGEFIIAFDEMPNTPVIQTISQPVVKKEETEEERVDREIAQGRMVSGGENRALMRF